MGTAVGAGNIAGNKKTMSLPHGGHSLDVIDKLTSQYVVCQTLVSVKKKIKQGEGG